MHPDEAVVLNAEPVGEFIASFVNAQFECALRRSLPSLRLDRSEDARSPDNAHDMPIDTYARKMPLGRISANWFRKNAGANSRLTACDSWSARHCRADGRGKAEQTARG
jgi:hypothetical protein